MENESSIKRDGRKSTRSHRRDGQCADGSAATAGYVDRNVTRRHINDPGVMESLPNSPNKVNLATAKFIPLFLAAIVVYISYTITGPLAVQYLLNPPNGQPVRLGAGIAIPIIYYLLLIPIAATYIRLLAAIWMNPGYTTLGSPKSSGVDPYLTAEHFASLNVFVCDSRGYPIWCAFCNNWKPDRAHHSQDAGRCTRKMDHFCPWVGGVVGERTYKFFVQFNFYSFLLSAFTMSVLAFYVAKNDERSEFKVQWLVALGLSAFFCLFTIGIFFNSLWMIFRNVTSIENVDSFTHTMLIAVLLPPELQGQDLHSPPVPPQAHLSSELSQRRSLDSDHLMTSDLNDPSHSSYFSNLHSSKATRRSALLPYQNQIWKGTVTYPLNIRTDQPPLPAPALRTYAILQTLPGMNIWDLGRPYLNFQSVFGTSLHDWLLPLKHSPCCDHTSTISQFPLGPDFEELLIEAGLSPRPASSTTTPQRNGFIESHRSTTSRKRRRKARLEPGWQNGERPDGWLSEKEARRLRNKARKNVQELQP